MLLALLVLALIALALALPSVVRATRRLASERTRARSTARHNELLDLHDPGRERRAEQRARELLRSCVNDEEWAMYRDLGFIRVPGGFRGAAADQARRESGDTPAAAEEAGAGARYAYLIYPHKPITAYLPDTGRLLSEYCVEFPDLTGPQSRLPASDDVLAKWMALTADEHRLIKTSNMHLPGRQVDPARVRRDLWRLSQWERERAGGTSRRDGGTGVRER